MRKILNGCYTACGVVSGLALVGIVAFVLIQIVARPLGIVVSWSAEFAGYAMAASSFMGLAYTLNSGGHIRVNLLADRLPISWQRWLERLCLLMAAGIVGLPVQRNGPRHHCRAAVDAAVVDGAWRGLPVARPGRQLDHAPDERNHPIPARWHTAFAHLNHEQ